MDNFNWTDELKDQYLKFCIESHSFSQMFGIDLKELFKTKIENYGKLTASDIISAYYKAKEPKKDYEILEFKHGLEDYVLASDGRYNSKCFQRIASLNHVPEKAEINSVRRLSDGEVFTIGDKITWGIPEDFFVTKINGFKIVNGRLEIDHDSFVKNISVDFEEAYKLKKVKEPLFTTEDGVEIHEGDKYWHVSRTYDVAPCKADKDVKYSLFESRTFSTKEAAEDWIVMNKPCLSIQDLVYGVNYAWITTELMRKLKELVKSKL